MTPIRWAVAGFLAGGQVLCVLGALPASAAGEGTWQGRYRYEADAGRTAGGTGAVVTYELTIGPSGARDACQLSARGFQTDERIVCHAEAGADGLRVAFHRYADGRTVNKYGVAVHRPGEALLTLSRGARGVLLTRWESLRPGGEGAPGPGPFFVAVR